MQAASKPARSEPRKVNGSTSFDVLSERIRTVQGLISSPASNWNARSPHVEDSSHAVLTIVEFAPHGNEHDS
jgi:hypothetical protein